MANYIRFRRAVARRRIYHQQMRGVPTMGKANVLRWAYLLVGPAVVASGLMTSAPALAECTSAAGTTICSQGDVRGPDSGDGPSGAGPVVPYPCEYDWYCDGWDLDVIVDPGPNRPLGPRVDNDLPGRSGIGRR